MTSLSQSKPQDEPPGTLTKSPPSRWVQGAASFGDLGRRYPMVVVLVLVLIGAQLAYPGFYAVDNLRNILQQNVDIGIIAVGMTFVLVSGGFDLSVGAIYALTGLLYARWAGDMPIPAAALAAAAVGGVCGAVNGVLITRLHINAFIATLATMSVFGGIALLVSSQPISDASAGFAELGNSTYLGLPDSVRLLIAVFVVGGAVLARTSYGRSLFVVGGNREAARLSGMRVAWLRASVYVLVGICSAVAAMVTTSNVGLAQPDAGGTLALTTITVVIVGGTSFLGGEGAIWKTAIGLIIISALTNVFDARALSSAVQAIITGLILVAAVGLDVLGRRRT